ncbi:von Willebrand factor type A domain-containing protein [Crocinitomicaceae bacterium]|nr:von Willebrand factor type A domain-containing protein [Crocinitomicaceae bacterium]MDB3907146.1 von Willebrand factor type A domain-containing protein [Crocinitomicaceae bacterium]
MKYLLTLLFGFSLSCFAQEGALNLTFLNNPTLGPLEMSIFLQEDSTETWLGVTNEHGQVLTENLPLGMQTLRFKYLGKDYGTRDFFVQERQLLSTTVLIDTVLAGIDVNEYGNYQIGAGGKVGNSRALINGNPGRTITRTDIARLPNAGFAAEIYSISEVAVVAYSVPLISRDAGTSGTTINRDDIRNMPTRSPGQMATTVGGVSRFEGDANNVCIRGARGDASNYYIDGVRVRSLPVIPQSSMNQITVWTGGVPASYGDFTGGIISVESKSYFDLYRAWKSDQLRSDRYFSYTTPEPIIETPEALEVVAEEVPEPELTPEQIAQKEHEEFIASLEPRISADRFHAIYENMFLSPKDHPNSTFGLDVDRASWTYVQNCIDNGIDVQRDAVKMEEMINAFNYRKVAVPRGELMHVNVVRSECMWNEESELLSVHLKAMDLPKDLPRKKHNFVFLVDVSGSMSSANKLPLLKEGLKEFVNTLEEEDVVSIVTYAGYVGVALEPTSNKQKVLTALDNLNSGGSTNGMGGVQKAYELAEANLDTSKNNRIILCTDGDFNVGISSTSELEAYISEKRGGGIYLTALGFGMGNYRSDVLESLADRGDGNHFYINSLDESRKVLVEEVGNLLNIARDVKLDVEFDSTMVTSYRLIGYENRMLQPEDFVDDTKDGGEIGYSHEVVAVYEIQRIHDSLLIDNEERIANVRLRYKPFEAENSIERGYPVYCKDAIERGRKLNTVVAFGLVMRNSAYSNILSMDDVYNFSLLVKPQNDDDKKLLELIEKYKQGLAGI